MLAETDLLTALRAGNPDALATLFDAHADKLYRLALSLLRDPGEAEDVVQETFLKAMTHAAGFEARSRLETWLYRIAYNASLDRLRRKPTEPMPDGEEADLPMPQSLVDWAPSPETAALNDEARTALDDAIAQLPESLRTVFALRDVEGLSTEATAEIVGVSVAAVKVRLHRARLALRERLAGYFGRPSAHEGALA